MDAGEVEEFRRRVLYHITVTKKEVAHSQLESAIRLWFADSDPISVHTLAVAANDCYCALAKHAGKASNLAKTRASLSKGYEKRFREAQNFFKHGLNDLTGKIDYQPSQGELLISDSVMTHELLFGTPTPLMSAFMLRRLLSEPLTESLGEQLAWMRKIPVDALHQLKDAATRADFLNQVLPFLTPKKTS